MFMSEGEAKVLIVEGIEELQPDDLEVFLVHAAALGVETRILSRANVKIFDDTEDELVKLVRSLPEDFDYGYFKYEELLEFVKKFFSNSDLTPNAINYRASRLWTYLMIGDTRQRYGPPLVDVREEPGIPAPTDPEQLRWRAWVARSHRRSEYWASLTDVVGLLRKYDGKPAPRKPFYNNGRDSIEAFARFALSKLDTDAELPALAE